jgi:beta-phosphoglucomutase-like phosphatase (HAD superfamily)
MTARYGTLHLDRIGAAVFEADGVVANTAPVHAATWKHSLDSFLRGHCRARGVEAALFDVQADYLRYFDGRAVPDGVRGFLASRGVDDESPALLDDLVQRQVALFLREIERYGVAPFRSCVALVRELRDRRAATAAVSTTAVGTRVLTAAQVASLFDVRVDRAHLEGAHPASAHAERPSHARATVDRGERRSGSSQALEEAVLAEAARRLRLPPAHIAVVLRSPTVVAAARRLGFGLVVGVDGGPTEMVEAPSDGALRRAGADLVVRDLTRLDVVGRRRASALVNPG